MYVSISFSFEDFTVQEDVDIGLVVTVSHEALGTVGSSSAADCGIFNAR